MAQRSDLVQKYLGAEAAPPSNSKLPRINSALWAGWGLLYLPPEVEVKPPFQVAYVLARQGSAIFPRTLIVADHMTRATYIEENISFGAHGQGAQCRRHRNYTLDGAQIPPRGRTTLGRGRV